MGAILILGGVVVLLALAVSSGNKRPETPVPVHPDSKSVDVQKMADKAKDPVVKDKLETTANILREAEKREVRIPANPVPPLPLAKVAPAKWKEYTKRSVRGAVGTRSQSGAMGLYQMSPKALESIGWVELDASGKISSWRAPHSAMTTAEFLASPTIQYQAFVEYTHNDLVRLTESKIKPLDYAKNHVVLAGQHATLSGLLGLTYYAGIANTEKWLRDPAWRDKAPKLTEQYKKFNGLF